MRFIFLLFITWFGPNYVMPLSFENKIFKPSINPLSDLTVISAQQTNFISKRWFNKIMEDFADEQLEILEKYSPLESAVRQRQNFESMNDIHILEHINTVEKFFQTPMKERYSYYAWMPTEEDEKIAVDVVALIVTDETTDYGIIIKCIIPNPCWATQNIQSKELKRCLSYLECDDRSLNFTEFYENTNNIRFKLDWSI